MTEKRAPAPPVRCPYCGSREAELVSLFGPLLLASQYFCLHCHSPFEAIRWSEEKPAPEPAGKP